MTIRMVLAALALVLAGCVGPSAAGESGLAERVWDVRAARFIAPEEAAALVARADFALLGESHDNARHHQIQLELLRTAAASGVTAVAFEQVDREWQAAVDAAQRNAPTVGSILEAGHVAASWKPALYAPLFDFAVSHGMRILAANYSRQSSRALVAAGIAAVDAPDIERLALARTWTPERQSKQHALIVEGHCGQDDPVVDKLVDVQRMRDAVMADAILQAPRAVAIIGRGHARADVGVPLYLHARAPDRRVISVGLVEVEAGKDRPDDYTDAAPGVHDLVWFTTAADRGDPCASLGKK
jgi:uncharacterized iron-regulated protein